MSVNNRNDLFSATIEMTSWVVTTTWLEDGKPGQPRDEGPPPWAGMIFAFTVLARNYIK
jgi:hypothetical protein